MFSHFIQSDLIPKSFYHYNIADKGEVEALRNLSTKALWEPRQEAPKPRPAKAEMQRLKTRGQASSGQKEDRRAKKTPVKESKVKSVHTQLDSTAVSGAGGDSPVTSSAMSSNMTDRGDSVAVNSLPVTSSSAHSGCGWCLWEVPVDDIKWRVDPSLQQCLGEWWWNEQLTFERR